MFDKTTAAKIYIERKQRITVRICGEKKLEKINIFIRNIAAGAAEEKK